MDDSACIATPEDKLSVQTIWSLKPDRVHSREQLVAAAKSQATKNKYYDIKIVVVFLIIAAPIRPY